MGVKMEKSSSGFTIIEIIFLVAIAGLVLGAIGSLLYSTIRAGENNENVLMAASLAQDVMERLRSIPYSKLKNLFSTLGENITGGIAVTLPDFYASFSPPPSPLPLDKFPQVDGDSSKIIKLQPSSSPNPQDDKGMEVLVEIKWKEAGRSDERSYRVATYFLEGGLNDYLSPTPSPTP